MILLLQSSAPNPPDMCNCAKVLRAAADDTAATRLLVPQQLKSCKAAAMGASWGGCQPLVGALTWLDAPDKRHRGGASGACYMSQIIYQQAQCLFISCRSEQSRRMQSWCSLYSCCSINHWSWFLLPLYFCCTTVWDFLPPAPTILLRQNMKRVADMPVSRSVLHTKRWKRVGPRRSCSYTMCY